MKAMTELLTAIAALVGALVWPALILFVIVKRRKGLADFVGTLREFSFKGMGVEASVSRQQIKAAVNVGAALVKPGQAAGLVDPSRAAAELADALPGGRAQRALQRSVALWVDDRPDNNRYERQALEALGIRVDAATSTEEALDHLHQNPVDVVISDMGRSDDPHAGYTLLDKMRSGGNHTPFVIYAGSRSLQHNQEARSHGAEGSTNSPQELIAMVTQAVSRTQARWSRS
ncbi:response regulator [Actinopolymorpha rutila]|uniref:CheY-like chemotaxis protein n=1 Tax=Actinopolymorpha rutila TaxID=446787 RepID=A0A852ZHU1_9ACTN|nr:response regulator [Actinopolymorpha rutila]NYH92504.1 CheY-like chemotaxis protein [Actinopolymorpha rutila]